MISRRRAFDRFTLLGLVLLGALALGAGSASARTETLRWTHPDVSSVANWEAHVGPAVGVYDQIIRLTNPTLGADGVLQSTIEVPDDAVVYIALRAIGFIGERSELSNVRERSPSGSGGSTPPPSPDPVEPPMIIQVVPAEP